MDPLPNALRSCLDSRTRLNYVLESLPDNIASTVFATISRLCLHGFTLLSKAISDASSREEFLGLMPQQDIKWEFDRFKIWCGNLGALQSGRSSLDARLRESSVMRENMLNNIARLYQTLIKSFEIASGARPPLEDLTSVRLDALSSDTDSDDEDDIGADQTLPEVEVPPRELAILKLAIKDIITGLYKLSYHIRSYKTRVPARSSLHREINPETGVDKFDEYASVDRGHVMELLRQWRRESAAESGLGPSSDDLLSKEDNFLIDRIVSTMNTRRRTLAYWQRHARKLEQESEEPVESMLDEFTSPDPRIHMQDDLAINHHQLPFRPRASAPSLYEGTILSQTEATTYDQRIDDHIDTQSAVSYTSSSAEFVSGQASIPPAPLCALEGTEFKCPYCAIVCPSRQGRGRSWVKHVTQDLQPYMCTYEDCPSGNQLYGSRSSWLEHERQAHRSVWACFRHSNLKFSSCAALQKHLRAAHRDEVNENSLDGLLTAARVATVDTREQCPFCLAWSPSQDGLDVHMAIHMLTFTNFCLPSNIQDGDEETDDGKEGTQSDRAQAFGSEHSERQGSISFNSPHGSDVQEDRVPIANYGARRESSRSQYAAAFDEAFNTLHERESSSNSPQPPNAAALPSDQNPLRSSAHSQSWSYKMGDAESNASRTRAPISHWAVKIFDFKFPRTPLLLPGEAIQCFGRAESPTIIQKLSSEDFMEVVRLPLDGTSFYVRLFWRPTDHRARILCSRKDGADIITHYCIPLTALKLTRKGSTLILWRLDRTSNEFNMWACLTFQFYEPMVMLYATFTAMKSQDSTGFADILQDKYYRKNGEEKEEYAGEIKDDDFLHALRIYRDVDTQCLRLEARAQRGAFVRIPIWFAFITRGNIKDKSWIRVVSTKVLQLADLHPYIFCPDYSPPSSKSGKFRLQFTTSKDAANFIDVINNLAEA